METIKQKISTAYKVLRREGYFARSNFMCCGSCGSAAVPESKSGTYVFYHRQDNNRFDSDGELLDYMGVTPGVYLKWNGDGARIVKALNDAGLETEWDGKLATCILIKGHTPPAINHAVAQAAFAADCGM